MFNNIPDELKEYPQWVVWKYEQTEGDKPTKVPYNAKTGYKASPTNNAHWTDFNSAVNAVSLNQYDGLGFVLTENDPFAFIDLDDTEGDEALYEKQKVIFDEFDSYAELSPSGKGLHIIVKGSIPQGRKRSKIEVYSSARYMTMTGNVFRNAPVKDYNEKLNVLYATLGGGTKAKYSYAGSDEAKFTNEQILEMATNAVNGELFYDLFYEGNWQKYYTSQSEGDLTLLNLIVFYSENREQSKELFLCSALGQREKSRKDYKIYTNLNKAFDNILPPVDISGLTKQLEEVIAYKKAESGKKITATHNNNESVYTVPPGLVGEIAQFIYAQAPHQIPEIALAGALGFMAGITGRSYNVSGTGLNQYIMLLAPTGAGKEAMKQGIDKIISQVVQRVPTAAEFMGPAEIASRQAIVKYMASSNTKSVVSVLGEFGITLQQMSAKNAPSHLTGIRQILLQLYNSSGHGNVIMPSIYSDKEKNTNAIFAPSFTLLGESTPEMYYKGLHEGLILDGLLPRFTTIEYCGKRPYYNENHKNVKPSCQLIDRVAELCAHSQRLNSQNQTVNIKIDESIDEYSKQFNNFCTDKCNNEEANEITRHLWSRVYMKVLKLAALIAVGNHPYMPIITKDIFDWSVKIIIADTNNILDKFASGLVGCDNEEFEQLKAIRHVIQNYITISWEQLEKKLAKGLNKNNYKTLRKKLIIPHSYILQNCHSMPCFKHDKTGAKRALDKTIQVLIDCGEIEFIPKHKILTDYEIDVRAKCYQVSSTEILN